MPRVEVTLTCLDDANFEQKKVIEIDTDEWMDMTPDERQERINDEAENFLRDTVDWDYKVL